MAIHWLGSAYEDCAETAERQGDYAVAAQLYRRAAESCVPGYLLDRFVAAAARCDARAEVR